MRDGRHDVAAAGYGAEHGVDAIQPTWTIAVVAVLRNQEELASAGMRGAGLGHGDGADFVEQSIVGFVANGVGC